MCGCQHRYAYHWFTETYMRRNQPKLTREQKTIMQQLMIHQLKDGKDLDTDFKKSLFTVLKKNYQIEINKTDYSIVFNNLRRTKDVMDLVEAKKLVEFQALKNQKTAVDQPPE